ncbi:M28 family metallopeptidase [Aestuariibaculum lutulentum]|uniref:M28 family metallopeptidase n=1 Tax=Aestuariibaculum lutulentum TaxID=2920935 RepID=A0ABS9RKJ8_9FLAO|nr:M28 family metallopeptidase [Aestuariibaculum lutulentum]MCH4553491.1 M28 family metallopeptidase [Aestuariibaculum lutulentum]
MKRLSVFLCTALLITSCGTSQNNKQQDKEDLSSTYAATITSDELKEALYTYASDDFEGRKTGEPGQKKAVNFLKDHYESLGIESPIAKGDYFQDIPESFFSNKAKASENVVAYIKGSEKPDEIIVISAHLDHIGVNGNGKINNGADDDGSGTVAILEIAEAFKKAANEGHGPKRSILFLHVTGEEIGLFGSRYYTDVDPIFPLENTVADLNIDMIGRVDKKHEDNRNYVYLIGSDKLSTELHNISEEVNKKYINMDFDYKYNDDNDPNRFYYRSDHYNFAKNNIPVIFYFNGTHDDYHRPSDTPDKIQYDLLETRARLVFHTAWELANREERIKLD